MDRRGPTRQRECVCAVHDDAARGQARGGAWRRTAGARHRARSVRKAVCGAIAVACPEVQEEHRLCMSERVSLALLVLLCEDGPGYCDSQELCQVIDHIEARRSCGEVSASGSRLVAVRGVRPGIGRLHSQPGRGGAGGGGQPGSRANPGFAQRYGSPPPFLIILRRVVALVVSAPCRRPCSWSPVAASAAESVTRRPDACACAAAFLGGVCGARARARASVSHTRWASPAIAGVFRGGCDRRGRLSGACPLACSGLPLGVRAFLARPPPPAGRSAHCLPPAIPDGSRSPIAFFFKCGDSERGGTRG